MTFRPMYRPYSNPDTRSSVLAALRDGADAAAWSRFFDLYASFVFLLARRRVGAVYREALAAAARDMDGGRA